MSTTKVLIADSIPATCDALDALTPAQFEVTLDSIAVQMAAFFETDEWKRAPHLMRYRKERIDALDKYEAARKAAGR